MPEMIAIAIWTAIGLYALMGAPVALWLLLIGFRRFDQNAAAAPLYTRLLWLPGLIALWPLLLRRALGAIPPEDRA
jgi:hypothetical protein